MKPKSKILIIAGSDSSGGAGIQADIKTITSLGSFAMTAITAVTAQNTKGVKSIVPMPIKEIYNQIEFTSKDIKSDSVKIGMLHSKQVINLILKSVNISLSIFLLRNSNRTFFKVVIRLLDLFKLFFDIAKEDIYFVLVFLKIKFDKLTKVFDLSI